MKAIDWEIHTLPNKKVSLWVKCGEGDLSFGDIYRVWTHGYTSSIENIDITVKSVMYTGFPCGENNKYFVRDVEIANKYLGNYFLSIEDLYKHAKEDFGLEKYVIDAFLEKVGI